MSETTTAPDIERAANAILSRVRVTHPVLHAWTRRIASDPNYAETLDVFYPPIDPADQLPERDELDADDPDDTPTHWPRLPVRGLYGHATWNDLFFDMEAFPEPSPDSPESVFADWSAVASADRAAYALAFAVVSFRWGNRPSGEQYHDLGFGIGISTGLAAAVAEFATDYADAWANAFARVQLDGLPGYHIHSSGDYDRYPGLRDAGGEEERP